MNKQLEMNEAPTVDAVEASMKLNSCGEFAMKNSTLDLECQEFSLEPKYLVSMVRNELRTTSVKVAEAFGKLHKDVLRKIESLDCSAEFASAHFCAHVQQVEVGNGAKRDSKYYEMTKDGFMFLVMGFTGKQAARIKEAYINAFNYMAGLLESSCISSETIGTAGLSCLAAVIDGKVRHLPAPARRSAKMHIWQQVHKAFSVVRAEQIPADKMDSARNFIAAQAVEGEWIGAEPAAPAYVVTQAEASWLKTMFVLMDDMVSVLREVRPALRSLDSPLCAKAYDSSAHIAMYQSEWRGLRNFCMAQEA